jgi:hypothetical protein
MLLTLAAGVWGGASAVASRLCIHESGAPSAPGEHDCCRADIARSNARHPESQEISHDAASEDSTAADQARDAHAGMNCGGADSASTSENSMAASGLRGLSCGECCAGGSGKTPAMAVVVVPEQNKVKRGAGADSTGASDPFAPVAIDISRLAPSQHAPPAPTERRHMLISVFLI